MCRLQASGSRILKEKTNGLSQAPCFSELLHFYLFTGAWHPDTDLDRTFSFYPVLFRADLVSIRGPSLRSANLLAFDVKRNIVFLETFSAQEITSADARHYSTSNPIVHGFLLQEGYPVFRKQMPSWMDKLTSFGSVPHRDKLSRGIDMTQKVVPGR